MPGFYAFAAAHQITELTGIGAISLLRIARAIDMSKPDGVPEFMEKNPLLNVCVEDRALDWTQVSIR